MRMTGICRRIDDLGRIVVPAEYRAILSLNGGDELEISMEGNRIILQKPSNVCAICGETENLAQVKDKFVCKSCIDTINNA